MGLPDEGEEGEDVPELKRDVLAMGDPTPGASTQPRRQAGPARRRRTDEAMEYVVHRDAGRVRNDDSGENRRVFELPPRYEELNLDEGDAADMTREGSNRGDTR
jgi:hypothetical protein